MINITHEIRFSYIAALICTIIITTVLVPNNVVAETSSSTIDNSTELFDDDSSDDDSSDEESSDEELCTEDNIEPIDELINDSEESIFSFFDSTQEFISTGVESFAKTLDEFFSDDKVFYDSSGTYLRLRNDIIWDHNGDSQYAVDLRFKLRLPHTNKKLKIVFETNADAPKDQNTTDASPKKAAEKNEYFAGIQTTPKEENKWKFKGSLGIRLRSKLDLYLRLRLNRTYDLNKWSIHWRESAYWFDSTGTGFDSSLEFNRRITKDDLFRATTFARWTDNTDYYNLSQTFSMIHTLSKNRAVSYSIGAFGNSKPTSHVTHYSISATYRQNVHKNYIFLEIVPQILFPKGNDFSAERSLLFGIEILFKK